MGYSLAGKMAEKPKSCATFQACKVSLWRPLCLGIRSTELAAHKSAASQMNFEFEAKKSLPTICSRWQVPTASAPTTAMWSKVDVFKETINSIFFALFGVSKLHFY
jgi:hypothetical protein